MVPTTLKGWLNSIVRGYPYNEKTADILDHTFRPSARLLSTLVDRGPRANSTVNLGKKSNVGKPISIDRKAVPTTGQPE